MTVCLFVNRLLSFVICMCVMLKIGRGQTNSMLKEYGEKGWDSLSDHRPANWQEE